MSPTGGKLIAGVCLPFFFLFLFPKKEKSNINLISLSKTNFLHSLPTAASAAIILHTYLFIFVMLTPLICLKNVGHKCSALPAITDNMSLFSGPAFFYSVHSHLNRFLIHIRSSKKHSNRHLDSNQRNRTIP